MSSQTQKVDTGSINIVLNVLSILAIIIIGVLIYNALIEKELKVAVDHGEVTVQAPDVKPASPHLKDMTYAELSVLLDAEVTQLYRMNNYFIDNPSKKLKTLIGVMADRVNVILAVREEKWEQESRELGPKANEYSSLKPILDDLVRALDQVPIPETKTKEVDPKFYKEPLDLRFQ